MKTTIYRYNETTGDEQDIPVIVEYEYQPSEKQELNYPGCPEEIEIISVSRIDGSEFEITAGEEAALEIECMLAVHNGALK
jgi:hypothetical protein